MIGYKTFYLSSYGLVDIHTGSTIGKFKIGKGDFKVWRSPTECLLACSCNRVARPDIFAEVDCEDEKLNNKFNLYSVLEKNTFAKCKILKIYDLNDLDFSKIAEKYQPYYKKEGQFISTHYAHDLIKQKKYMDVSGLFYRAFFIIKGKDIMDQIIINHFSSKEEVVDFVAEKIPTSQKMGECYKKFIRRVECGK